MNNYDFLLPVLICVVLPVLIVWIVGRVRQNETNRRAEVMLRALEKGVEIDPNLLQPDKRKKRSIKQDLLDKLSGACITSLMGLAFLALSFFGNARWFPAFSSPLASAVLLAVGIGLFISYFAGKKMLAKEIEAEEKKLLEDE